MSYCFMWGMYLISYWFFLIISGVYFVIKPRPPFFFFVNANQSNITPFSSYEGVNVYMWPTFVRPPLEPNFLSLNVRVAFVYCIHIIILTTRALPSASEVELSGYSLFGETKSKGETLLPSWSRIASSHRFHVIHGFSKSIFLYI